MYSKDLDLVKQNETGFNGYSAEFNAFCLPDWYITKYEASNRKVGTEIDKGGQKYPWENKEEKAFFRGVSTGADLDYYSA